MTSVYADRSAGFHELVDCNHSIVVCVHFL